jgi:hypothetical protein
MLLLFEARILSQQITYIDTQGVLPQISVENWQHGSNISDLMKKEGRRE